MHRAMLAAAMIALTGCDYSVPVTGRIGNDLAQGQSTASLSGGTFSVTSIRGLQCQGTYDALSREPTIVAPVSCADGRSGNLIITRTMDGMSGTVIGRLNDGTEAQFVFGDLTFQQAFDGTTSSIR